MIMIGSTISIGAYSYYKIESLQKANAQYIQSIAVQENNIATLKEGISLGNATIGKLQKEYLEIETLYNETNDAMQLILLQNQELPNKLQGRDLDALSVAKPELIEKILNDSSDEYGRCIEVITGMQKKHNEENDECPWIFEGDNNVE